MACCGVFSARTFAFQAQHLILLGFEQGEHFFEQGDFGVFLRQYGFLLFQQFALVAQVLLHFFQFGGEGIVAVIGVVVDIALLSLYLVGIVLRQIVAVGQQIIYIARPTIAPCFPTQINSAYFPLAPFLRRLWWKCLIFRPFCLGSTACLRAMSVLFPYSA